MSTKTNTPTPVDVTKITKGEWKYLIDGQGVWAKNHQMMVADIRGWGHLSSLYKDDAKAAAEQDANGLLVAEAGTVANETGLSPGQMRERLDEAVRLLRSAGRALNHEAKCHLLERGAIGKSETCEYYVKGINAFLSALTKHP